MSVTVTPSNTQSTWAIDPTHTLVEFSVRHMVVTTTKGRFGTVSGSLVLDEANLSNSSIVAEIDATSIDTRESQRDAHLRSADFLDTENHPTLTFKSTRVEPVGDDRAAVYGDLTIRGVTRPVKLDVELNGQTQDPWGGTRAGFSAHTTINRGDFGLNWNVALEAGGFLVSDQVKINLEIEAIKQTDQS